MGKWDTESLSWVALGYCIFSKEIRKSKFGTQLAVSPTVTVNESLFLVELLCPLSIEIKGNGLGTIGFLGGAILHCAKLF